MSGMIYLRPSLLTLGKAETSFVLLPLNRSLFPEIVVEDCLAHAH